MAQGTGVPLDDDLDSFLVSRGARSTTVPICCTIDPDLMAVVERKVGAGVNTWKALVEWLASKGAVLRPDQLARHFNNGVPHARP